MKRKNIILVLLSCILIFNLMGCSGNKTSTDTETNYYKLNIDGEKEFISEDDKEVKDIAAFTEEFIDVYVGVDYKSDKYKTELNYYTSAGKELRIKSGYIESIAKQLAEYELTKEVSDFDLEMVEFYKVGGVETSEITCVYTATTINASEKYLQVGSSKLNQPIKTRAKILLEKENDNWYVSRIISREKVEE